MLTFLLTYIKKERIYRFLHRFFFLSIRSILIWKILWYYKKKKKIRDVSEDKINLIRRLLWIRESSKIRKIGREKKHLLFFKIF